MQAETAQLEQLIRALNDPQNQGLPDKIYEVQKQIQHLQRDASAWQMGLDLLENPEAQIRFFGALTLTIKVNADWENDKVGEDRNALHRLLERLVTSYVRLAAVGDALFVIQKLCTTLVAVFQKPDSAWAFPIRHVLTSTVSGQYVKQSKLPTVFALCNERTEVSISSLHSALLLALTMAEEAGTPSTTSKMHNLHVRLSNNLPDVWSLIHYCTVTVAKHLTTSLPGENSTYHLDARGTHDQIIGLANLILRTIPHWLTGVKHKQPALNEDGSLSCATQLHDAVRSFLHLYSQQHLAEAIVQAFALMEQTSHNLLLHVCPGYAEHIVRSTQTQIWITLLLQGDFDPDAVNYVSFLEAYLSQIDVTNSDYLKIAYHIEMLDHIQRLLSCVGAAGVEDTVCPLVLDVLSPVIEGFGDWPETSEYGDGFTKMAAQSCSACLIKLRMPEEELKVSTQTWETDDRARFQDFRYDVHDFLQNAFSILGVSLIEEVVESLLAPEHVLQWHIFEADMFSLLAFIDTMTGEPDLYDQYLEAVLTSPNWSAALSNRQDTPERVTQQMIKLVGEITGFLQRHPQHLISSLNFLFEALHVKASTMSASRAISTLCDAERVTLVEALPQFMSSLGAVSRLESDARNRIFGGVSAIIQALPSEQAKVEPLMQVLVLIEADVRNPLATHYAVQEFRSKSADIFYTLAAIGKGLRRPSDANDELCTAAAQEVEFWTGGSGSHIQQITLQIYDTLYQRTVIDEDSAFVEATCEFLRSTFTEDHPSPMRFPSNTIVTILGQYIHSTVPQPDLVMGTVTSYFATADVADPHNGFTSLLSQVLTSCGQTHTAQQSQERQSDTDYQAAILEMVARILPKWGRLWLAQPDYHAGIQTLLEMAIHLINDATNPLSRRAAAYFVSGFLDSSARTFIASDAEASAKMTTILQTYGPRILGTVLHLLGGECPRSDLDNLTEPLKKFITKQPLMANRLMKEAMKEESGVLSAKAIAATKPEQRLRIASQVEMLRGQRKTNEVIKEFWIACRGSGFGYVT